MPYKAVLIISYYQKLNTKYDICHEKPQVYFQFIPIHHFRNVIHSLTSCKRTEVYTNVDAKEPNSFQTNEDYLDEVKLDEIVEEDENTNEILESEFAGGARYVKSGNNTDK